MISQGGELSIRTPASSRKVFGMGRESGSDISDVIVLIPAFNNSGTIYSLVSNICVMGFRCLVIDDGSSDETARRARSAGAMVMRHRHNRGKGAAIKTGLTHARKTGFTYLVLMDGDGQHDPREIPLFVKKARISGADLIVGNRLDNPAGMPALRFYTNRICSLLTSVLCGFTIPDSQCGFRLLSRNFALEFNPEQRCFQIETETLYKAAVSGFKTAFVPVSCIYNPSGRASHVNPITDTGRFLRYYFACLFARIKVFMR